MPLLTALGLLLLPGSPAPLAPASTGPGWTRGPVALESIGELAFGPDCLFVSDPLAGAVYAVRLAGDAARVEDPFLVADADVRIAGLLGTTASELLLTDLAVDPRTGATYLALMRGRGAAGRPVLVRADAGGFSEVALDDVEHMRKSLASLPTNRPGDRTDRRLEAITDMAYANGRLYVAGLSNEEFASRFRSYAYPFGDDEADTAVEVYHGNHAAYETHAPVRTFLPYDLDGVPSLVAAYTCTPLVTFPVGDLADGAKVRGRTVAELGGGNVPQDLIAYEKGGERFLLLSNSRRGVMKIPAAELGGATPITSGVGGIGGVGYETITDLDGVQQMASSPDGGAVAWIEDPISGSHLLASIDMP